MCGVTRKQPSQRLNPRSRLQAPDFVVIIDNCRHNLRDPSVSCLVKICRHLHIKLILATQNTADISPISFRNIDSVIICRGMTVDKLFQMYELLDIHVAFDVFLSMYNSAVSKPFAFFNIDCRLDGYKICFNEELIVS